jgi:hypothetical protein
MSVIARTISLPRGGFNLAQRLFFGADSDDAKFEA